MYSQCCSTRTTIETQLLCPTTKSWFPIHRYALGLYNTNGPWFQYHITYCLILRLGSALALASGLTLRDPCSIFFLGAPKYDPSYVESFSTGDLNLQGQVQACRGHHLKNHLN